MLEIKTIMGTSAGTFKDFEGLFNCIEVVENLKIIAQKLDFTEMNWRFTIYLSRQVAALYNQKHERCEAIKKAIKEGVCLIEICTGDNQNPTYITVTPNVNIDYLKEKWCRDYCTHHNLVVREV